VVEILSAFNRFERAHICVVGDLILDTYTFGRICRISPEAPVSVMEAERDERRLGGAANVALNLKSLGMDVDLIGCIGDDEVGADFCTLLESEGIDAVGIVCEAGRATSLKNRLIASGQQVLRVDREKTSPIRKETEELLFERFVKAMEKASILLFSDYAKGLLSPELLQRMIAHAKVPIIVDPKGVDFSKYRGATLIKPNLKESHLASGEEDLDQAAKRLLAITEAEHLFITRANEGISVFNGDGRRDFPTRSKEVTDVTGAGDTVCATLACCMANGWSPAQMAELANVAASLAIEEVGCARITLSKLAKRLLDLHLTTKVFEESHLFALRQVLKEHTFYLLTLRECTAFSAPLYEAIRKAKRGGELLIYLDKSSCRGDLLDILRSLTEVDYILLHDDPLEEICPQIRPAKAYSFIEGRLVEGIEPASRIALGSEGMSKL